MKNTYLIILSCFLTLTAQAQTRWTVDQSNSTILFEVSHLAISSVTGKFSDFTCEMEAKKNSFEGAKINAEVKVNSISTENLTRDMHLKKDDFFNAETFPKMTFVSETFKKIDDKSYELIGQLTIRDVTKKITVPVDFSGTVTLGDRTVSVFKAGFTINRFDYKLKWDDTLDTGSLVVGEDVDIKLNLVFVKS